VLNRHKSYVVDGHTADLIVVLARAPQGLSLFTVDGNAPGLTRRALKSMDPTRKFARLERPYVSPFGVPGAIIAMIIAAVTLVTLFLNVDYRLGVVGAAIWFALGLAYFVFHARHRLIMAPEEEFAASHRSE